MPTRSPDDIAVVIADDQVLFAESLSYVLHGITQRIRVIGIAADGEQAFGMARSLQPDIILMDVRMPKVDGVEATRMIHDAWPDIRIVMLTTFDDDEYVHAAVAHGAVGYLLKNIRPDALVNALAAVMSGATLFGREITAKMVARAEDVEAVRTILDGLSRRERDVLRMAGQMMNNSQIADALHLSDHSVRNYMSTLYHAFDVKDRFELIQKIKDLPIL